MLESETVAAPLQLRQVTKRVVIIAIAIILVLAIVKYLQISKAISEHASFVPPPEAVTSASAEQVSWPVTLDLVGSLEASSGVILSVEDPGTVAKIGVESGAKVNKGDVLIQLDVTVETAKLNSAKAMLDLAEVDLKRATNLRAQKAISEQELNNAAAERQSRQGQFDELKAMIARKTISAPFSGRTGIRMVNQGQYLESGAKLVPLYALDPLFLNFSVPQQQLPSVKVGQIIDLTIDVFPGKTFSGKVTAIDPQIDPSTRNARVQATVSNPNEELSPGMFARTKLILSASEKLIAIPTSAVNYAPYGNSVYVIETVKDPTGREYLGVRQQFVKLGQARGDQVAIVDGLKPGEQVATSGVFKLRPGAAVVVNNTVTPGNNPVPKPEDK